MSRVFTDEGVKLVVLTAIPVNPEALTTTLLAAGKDLSDYAVAGESQFEQAASDSISEKRYSDKGKVDIPTTKNQNVKAVLYRDRDVDGGLSVTDPLQYFDDRQEVCWVRRKGVPEDTAWAAGQDYSYFIVRADEVVEMNDNDGGFEKMTVGFKSSGGVGFGVVVAP